MGAPGVPRTRSRTGCLSCRLRKVKCDESSYPVCSNCKHKELPCSWPASKKAIYETLKEIKYIGGKEESAKGRVSKRKKAGNPKLGNVSVERPLSQRYLSPREIAESPYQTTFTDPAYKYALYSDVSSHRRPFLLEPQLVATPTGGAVGSGTSVSAIWADNSSSSMLKKIALQEECVEEPEIGDEKKN